MSFVDFFKFNAFDFLEFKNTFKTSKTNFSRKGIFRLSLFKASFNHFKLKKILRFKFNEKGTKCFLLFLKICLISIKEFKLKKRKSILLKGDNLIL